MSCASLFMSCPFFDASSFRQGDFLEMAALAAFTASSTSA